MANEEVKFSYTGKDYKSILSQLIEIAPELSNAFNPKSENDPSVALLKLIAMNGDMLAFYQDKIALETSPETMTQRKIADKYYKLFNYYMDLYRPASTTLRIHHINTEGFILHKYTQFISENRSKYAVLLENIGIKANGGTQDADVPVIEGTYNSITISIDDVVDYIYKLPKGMQAISRESVTITDDAGNGNTWTQVDNIDLVNATDLGLYYDIELDDYDNVFIRFLPRSFDNIIVTKFVIEAVVSSGIGTTISQDEFKNGIIKDEKLSDANIATMTIVSNSISPEPTKGYETPQEAFQNAKGYINTVDTLVSCSDYENAIKRVDDVSNARVTDKTNEPITGLPSSGKDCVYRYINGNFKASDATIENMIISALSNYKALGITHEFSDDYFICDWQPQGTITLSETIDSVEAEELLATICKRLSNDYHPRNMQFGTGVKLVDIINSIKSYDDRILSVDLAPIVYKITNPSETDGDCDDILCKLFATYIGDSTHGDSSMLPKGITGTKFWNKFRKYKDVSGTMTGQPTAGLNAEDSFTDYLDSLGVINDYTELDYNPDLDTNGHNPLDFFDVTHPYNSIAIPRFANYKYYEDDADALDTFKSFVKINRENIK